MFPTLNAPAFQEKHSRLRGWTAHLRENLWIKRSFAKEVLEGGLEWGHLVSQTPWATYLGYLFKSDITTRSRPPLLRQKLLTDIPPEILPNFALELWTHLCHAAHTPKAARFTPCLRPTHINPNELSSAKWSSLPCCSANQLQHSELTIPNANR
jgi:hypothetical protein